MGAVVNAKFIRPLEDGRREVLGILQAYQNSVLTLETEEGEFLDIDKKDTSSVRVCDDYVDIDDEDVEEEF